MLRNIYHVIIASTNFFNLKYWLLRDTCNKQNVGGSDYPRRPEAEVSEKALFTTVDKGERRLALETMQAAVEQVSRAHQLHLVYR